MTQILISNGTLIDGRGGDPLPGASVLVEENKIVAVAARGEPLQAELGAQQIDARGGFILPGFFDAHVHVMLRLVGLEERLGTPFSLRFYQSIENMRSTLMAGVTSVRDAGGADLGTKRAVEQGLVAGPRLQISTAVLGITGGHVDAWHPSGSSVGYFPDYPGMPDGICDGVAEVRRKVREVLRAGADVVKICATGGVLSPTDHPEFTQFSPEELAVIVQEAAYRRGTRVMAHAQGTEGVKQAIRAGIHSIEHGIFLDDEAVELMLEHGTFLVPTLLAPLAVLELGQAGGMPEYGLRKSREVMEAHQESVTRAHKAGVKIALGTDAGVMPHGTNLRELALMVNAGLSPMEAIVAGTRTAAECLGWEDRLGTIEPGKLADIVISAVDPLADIKALADNETIWMVMQNGRIVKS
jgi:imidazolonepropionase-like amidohydrolase